MTKPHIIILGAGPAGLGAAYRLARDKQAQVTVLEANGWVGGNAGSFELAGQRVDYGSHRLHPACPPDVLQDIRTLLGDDLLDRPRHGRIRLQGRWIHFPLKPADLMLRLPPQFAAGVAADALRKPFAGNGKTGAPESFASVLEAGLGKTICREFYFPYARKLWGLPPEELAAQQARRRVSAGSLGRMMRKVLNAVPGLKPKGAGRFFYPRRGYGQISEAYSEAAMAAGAAVRLGARVEAVEAGDHALTVRFQQNGQSTALQGDYVWSTIPITGLARSLKPAPPAELVQAAGQIDYRAMILIYLVLGTGQFTEYDAHYFPQEEIAISRLSEPKNYAARAEPSGRTVLCAELPCTPDGPQWHMSDRELQDLLLAALERAGIPVQAPVLDTAVRRLRHAYPIYRSGYQDHFDRLDEWLGSVPRLLSFGRQGLFAHDNTHHALYMGYCAAACLRSDGSFDSAKWADFRQEFTSHVVED